ncbi:hypothetical protein SI65_05270 [Aspergillus cristatus]|uniref:Uncharacterized protein n=1 Tax=Aspergillus cristatus TaxID=573508 RepID=A0A1E3BCF2_ASPCR|nr:hypothetical protein SI65_05270 [Aspergillus cristatus]
MPKVPPSTPPRQNADRPTRDDRLRIITLRDAGHSYQQIIDHLDVSYNQVQFTCMNRKLTPRKARGKLSKLSDEKVDEIIAWYTASEGNHSLPYRRVIQEFGLGVSEDVLVRALRRREFWRRKALDKAEQTVQVRGTSSGSGPAREAPSGTGT